MSGKSGGNWRKIDDNQSFRVYILDANYAVDIERNPGTLMGSAFGFVNHSHHHTKMIV